MNKNRQNLNKTRTPYTTQIIEFPSKLFDNNCVDTNMRSKPSMHRKKWLNTFLELKLKMTVDLCWEKSDMSVCVSLFTKYSFNLCNSRLGDGTRHIVWHNIASHIVHRISYAFAFDSTVDERANGLPSSMNIENIVKSKINKSEAIIIRNNNKGKSRLHLHRVLKCTYAHANAYAYALTRTQTNKIHKIL